MKKILLALMALSLLTLPLSAQDIINPDKGPGSMNVVTGGGVAIPDDAYDGTIASMACVTAPGAELIVDEVSVDLAMNHTWVGDLTIKVQSPAGTVSTVMSRPAFDEMVDDGSGCCGNNADLIETSPISFSNAGVTSAEDMGNAGGFVCQDDGLCSYFPFPDSAPGVDLADFAGEEGTGDWMVCVGDSAAGDTGEVISAGLTITGSPLATLVDVPTMGATGLTFLLIALALAGVVFIRRK